MELPTASPVPTTVSQEDARALDVAAGELYRALSQELEALTLFDEAERLREQAQRLRQDANVNVAVMARLELPFDQVVGYATGSGQIGDFGQLDARETRAIGFITERARRIYAELEKNRSSS